MERALHVILLRDSGRLATNLTPTISEVMTMKLYEYFRSSASYRVRIALNLKRQTAEAVQIHLLRNGGEQFAPAFRAINPQARVPALVLNDGATLIQSPAILEWLEETYPEPPLLPRDPVARARIRAMAALIACDIHPLNNLAVLAYLRDKFGQDEAAIGTWYRHWIALGFEALEQLVSAPFADGATLTLADVYLVPQVANARRQKLDLTPFPRIEAIEQACLALKPFADARPEAQKAASL
jgi:maleylacetoacetate isomerase